MNLDPNLPDVDNVIRHKNFVAVIGVWKGSNTPCGFFNVYAPLEHHSKLELWNYIINVIINNMNKAWLICGEFKEVRNKHERKGSSFLATGALHFNQFVDSLGLLDLRIVGRKYT